MKRRIESIILILDNINIYTEMEDPMSEYLLQAWSLQGQLPLLITIAALLGLGKGGVPGFATIATAATVATSPTNISGGLGFAVALQVPILTMIDISAAWLHCRDLDFGAIKLLVPMSFVGMAIGQYLDRHLTDAHARLLVGIFLLLILAIQVGKDLTSMKIDRSEEETVDKVIDHAENGMSTSNIPSSDGLRRRNIQEAEITTQTKHPMKKTKPSEQTRYIWACVVGIVGGAATMLTNAMGPILNVFLLSVLQLSPTAYIGTRAMFFCVLNCGKIPMRFLNGTLAFSMIPLSVFLGMISVVGVFGAKPIMLSMSQSNFVRLELLMVLFSGLRLCWMGLHG